MEWKIFSDPVEYEEAVALMENRVAGIRNGNEQEAVWLLEHPPLYTAGTSAKAADLLKPQFPVHETGRGGEYTYHGPGQRVAYVMLDLKKRFKEPDIKKYIWMLEEWIIQTLSSFNIKGERREGRIGIWVTDKNGTEAKIAAIGVRIRHWVSYHGISINVSPDLSHFNGIVPCGIKGYGVTSIKEVLDGVSTPPLADMDKALEHMFARVFSSVHSPA